MHQRFFSCEFSSFILADYHFWNDHYDDLQAWCDLNSAELKGMMVTCPNAEVRSLFILKWS